MSDLPEVEELERAAEWRLRKVDQDPTDGRSAEAARLLDKLANELRASHDSQLYREYAAICNWLSESDGISEFEQLAYEYRSKIGIDHFPIDGEAYLRALIDLAKQTFGTL